LSENKPMTREAAEQFSELMVSIGKQVAGSLAAIEKDAPADHPEYREWTSRVLTAILVEVMNPFYAEHPDLKPKELS